VNSHSDPSLRTEILQGEKNILGIGYDWDDLFARATEASPHLSYAWAKTFLEERRFHGTPLCVLVWSEQKLVALLPLVVRRILNKRLAEPVGAGQPSYLGLLLDSNFPSAIREIVTLFKQKMVADMLCINSLWSEDKATNKLVDELREQGFLCLKTYRNPCYSITLGPSFEEYLNKTISSRRRRELKRNEKKILELGAVDFEEYSGNDITDALIRRMASLQEESWMKRRECAVLSQPFYRKLLVGMSNAGFGHAWFVKINGSDAAFGFGYVAHRRFYYEWTAFKLTYEPALSVGKVLTSWLIKDVCKKGLMSFDFGHGEGWYKQFWANECNSVYRIVVAQGLVARILAALYFVVFWLGKRKPIYSVYHRLNRTRDN